MKRLALATILLASAAISSAQSLEKYLQLRQSNHIEHAVETNSLQNISGSRILELRGTIKGSFRQSGRLMLLIGASDGSTHEIDSDIAPEWLLEGDSAQARLLVKAIRSNDSDPVRILLLGAAREEDIAPIDAALEAKRQKATDAANAAKAAKRRPSRNSRTGLFGPIGRHASRGSTRQWMLPASQVTPIYASFIKSANPRLSNAEALTIAQSVVGFCLQYNVDARLVMSVIIVESGFDPTSVSHSGAMGLGQLMPSTARWMGVSNPFNDIENVYGMVKLLHTHLEQYSVQTGGDPDRTLQFALAAYNAGEGAVRRSGGVPPYRETQAYVRHVLSWYAHLRQ